MSFSPLNSYTFAAARGQFLRSDVRALLKEAPVGLFADLLAPHDPDVRRAVHGLRRRLDSLLFTEPRPQADDALPLGSNALRDRELRLPVEL